MEIKHTMKMHELKGRSYLKNNVSDDCMCRVLFIIVVVINWESMQHEYLCLAKFFNFV